MDNQETNWGDSDVHLSNEQVPRMHRYFILAHVYVPDIIPVSDTYPICIYLNSCFVLETTFCVCNVLVCYLLLHLN
jgi:hypothetical protein